MTTRYTLAGPDLDPYTLRACAEALRTAPRLTALADRFERLADAKEKYNNERKAAKLARVERAQARRTRQAERLARAETDIVAALVSDEFPEAKARAMEAAAVVSALADELRGESPPTSGTRSPGLEAVHRVANIIAAGDRAERRRARRTVQGARLGRALDRRDTRARRDLAPLEGDTFEQLAEKAERCGHDLDPNDLRSKWIDDHRDDTERELLIAAYHAGQAERYEEEEW